MAKTIMSADKTIQRAEVRFYEKLLADHYTEITVRSGNVKAFGAGITTEDEFLGSLLVSKGIGTETSTGSAESQSVASAISATPQSKPITDVGGAKKEDRTKLAERIQLLKSKGVGVKPFLTQLAAVDELAKSGESIPLMEKMEQLEDSVSDQEKVLAERTRVASVRITPMLKTESSAPPRPEPSALLRLIESHIQSQWHIDLNLVPEGGPYFHQRENLAWMIQIFKSKGYSVVGFMTMWAECQELARENKETELRYKMMNIAKAMKLKDPIKDEEWYDTQLQLYKKEWHDKHEREEHHRT